MWNAWQYNRHITKEELEMAMKEDGAGDEGSIKQIIADADTDNVSWSIHQTWNIRPVFFETLLSNEQLCYRMEK